MNILKIAFANIRKRKGTCITFLVMVMLSALMLSISLSLLIGASGFYDKKVDELNAPHYTDYIVEGSYKDEFTAFAENYEGVTGVSVLNALFGIGTWHMESQNSTNSIFFINETESGEKSFYKPPVIDRQAVKAYDMVIMPVSFKSNGIKSGDKISLELSGKNYEFTVHGFFEDAVMGGSTIGANMVYIGGEKFNDLKSDENFSGFVSLIIRFKETEMYRAFRTDFGKFAKLNSNEEVFAGYDGSKAAACTFINFLSMILIVFSLIILAIAFIVAVFSINNGIAEDITVIGALKSIGYKNKALRCSQLMQYSLIAGTGTIIGVLVSLFTFGFLGNIIASTAGLLWANSANIIPVILTVFTICGLTCLITYVATRKYRKITPINALRQGDSNHSFRKNAVPLEKYKMPLTLHLGIKRFFNSVKNNITLCIVVSLLVFVSLLVYAISYNLNEDRSAMINMVGLEMSELYIQANPGTDITSINEAIISDTEVDRTLLSGTVTCTVNDCETSVETVEDYSKLTINTAIKGRFPALKNEISLGSAVAKATGMKIGDTVTVDIYGIKSSYVVVGITQNIGNGGDICQITFEDMLSHNEGFEVDTVFVYLKDGIDVKTYYNTLKNTYGNKIMIVDTNEQMDTILSSLGDPFAAISVIMIIITVIIIALILFLMISAIIRKQKKELGIMKAIGYKNRNLILQLLISFMPALLVGSTIGILLGFLVTNPLMSAFFSVAGLLKTYFIIPALPTILIGFALFCVSIMLMFLISLRLRKVSPQKLITV